MPWVLPGSRLGSTAEQESGSSLELPRGFVKVEEIGGWPKFVTLKDSTILAMNGNERRASDVLN